MMQVISSDFITQEIISRKTVKKVENIENEKTRTITIRNSKFSWDAVEGKDEHISKSHNKQ